MGPICCLGCFGGSGIPHCQGCWLANAAMDPQMMDLGAHDSVCQC